MHRRINRKLYKKLIILKYNFIHRPPWILESQRGKSSWIHTREFSGMIEMFCILTGLQIYILVKTHWFACLRSLHLIVHKLYLNKKNVNILVHCLFYRWRKTKYCSKSQRLAKGFGDLQYSYLNAGLVSAKGSSKDPIIHDFILPLLTIHSKWPSCFREG